MADQSWIDSTTLKIRGVARIWSVMVFILAMIVIIGTVTSPVPIPVKYSFLESLVPGLILMSVVGLGVAWRSEGWGSLINLGGFGLSLILYWGLYGHFMNMGFVSVLSAIILPGILFGVVWIRKRKLQKPQIED